jgi:GGDEF domain-containing protein
MSQGSIVVIAAQGATGLSEAIATAGAFPVIDATAHNAGEAIAAAAPSAVILADPCVSADPALAALLAREITRRAPIVPVLALTEAAPAYREALAMAPDAAPQAIAARLASGLRARALHAALLRRAEAAQAAGQALPSVPAGDPLDDATVILAGRGRSHPNMSVALGARTGLIGVLTIEAAARYLKSRDADGLVIGEGFYPRNVEAMLTVVAEDPRFRDLPVGIVGNSPALAQGALPHLVCAATPEALVARVLPLVRLHAFEARLRRAYDAFEKDGIVDPNTGLLRHDAFAAELKRALRHAGVQDSGLSLARFSFEAALDTRTLNDAARLVGKLVRGADFACRDEDGSILVAFTETDLRNAQTVARRLAGVLKQTMLHPDRRRASAPRVTLTGRKSADTVESLVARATPAPVAAR